MRNSLKKIAFLCLMFFSTQCWGKDQELIILTSHAESYVQPIQEAFEKEFPHIKLRFLFKKTPAAIAHIEKERQPIPDVLLASSTDAFEGLKANQKLKPFVGPSSTYDDPERYFKGVALAGYVSMWNKAYLKEHGLKAPKTWDDLLSPTYENHIAITSPTRSGTMHVIVETVLQSYGWQKGWAYLLELAGNLATITARSYGISDGISKGRFGIGLVIDFFALGTKATDPNIDFTYFPNTSILPASAAIVAKSHSPENAELFLAFLVSDEGQRLLSHPAIMRLPIREEALNSFPKDFPNPFDVTNFVETHPFDTKLSSQRYQLVNVMFDQLITYRLSSLNKAWSIFHRLERQGANPEALQQVRQLLTKIPVGDMMSTDPVFLSQFSHAFPGTTKSSLQTRLEQEWEAQGEKDIKRALDMLHEIEISQEGDNR